MQTSHENMLMRAKCSFEPRTRWGIEQCVDRHRHGKKQNCRRKRPGLRRNSAVWHGPAEFFTKQFKETENLAENHVYSRTLITDIDRCRARPILAYGLIEIMIMNVEITYLQNQVLCPQRSLISGSFEVRCTATGEPTCMPSIEDTCHVDKTRRRQYCEIFSQIK
jgi:hypothetical protein